MVLGGAGADVRVRLGCMDPSRTHSGLHELRMTVQATLTWRGCCLCGALYLSRGIARVPRSVVVLLILITAVTALVCGGRSGARWSTAATFRGWRRAMC